MEEEETSNCCIPYDFTQHSVTGRRRKKNMNMLSSCEQQKLYEKKN
jgi:hypothetical protein